MERLALLLRVLLPALMLVRCSTEGPTVAGSGSESPNAITGTVSLPPAAANPTPAGAEAVLFAITHDTLLENTVEYQWKALDTVTTDGNGRYEFADMTDGLYTIIIQKDGYKAFSGYIQYRTAFATLTLDYVLKNTQNIRGAITDTAKASNVRIYLGLVGTPYFDTIAAAQDSFNFTEIPQGIYNWDIRSELLTDWQSSVLVSIPTAYYSYDSLYVFRSPDHTKANGIASDTLFADWASDTLEIRTVQDTISFQHGNYSINYTIENNP